MRPKDPFAEREAKKYDHPVASRELVIAHLVAAGAPLSAKRLCKELGVETQAAKQAMKARLRAMVRDGQLVRDARNIYRLPDEDTLFVGEVRIQRPGRGVVVDVARQLEYPLPRREVSRLFHGDRVRVGLRHGKKRVSAYVLETVSRQTWRVIGHYRQEGRVGVVVPIGKNSHQRVIVRREHRLGAGDDQMVVVRITTQPSEYEPAEGEVISVVDEREMGAVVREQALAERGMPYEWPDAVVAEAEELDARPSPADTNRRDLEEIHFITIDGADARDFDDAVFCEAKSSGGWRLYVAIADVSHYVTPGSAIDQEAARRGTSVYFPKAVVPMLPEALSTGLCSLTAGEPKLVVVCEMTISSKGRISGYRFYEAAIVVRERCTYEQIAARLTAAPQETALDRLVADLHGMFRQLVARRQERGALDFDGAEATFEFDEDGVVSGVNGYQRNDAHRIIEEAMLCANVCASRWLGKHKVPALYRVHERPTPEKVAGLRDMLGHFGLALEGGDLPAPSDFQRLLDRISGTKHSKALQTVVLRSLQQAVYQVENRGHFGLSYEEYTHFTSPIRRYPDLVTHRAIKAVLRGYPDRAHEHYPYDIERLGGIGGNCSMLERRAEDAEYSVTAWLKCELLARCVGERFSGLVTAVTGFGLFVELEGYYIEGLVHVSNLPGDYYRFDPKRHELEGDRSGTRYRIGQRVEVILARVTPLERKVDCEIVTPGGPVKKGGRKGRAGAKGRRPRRGARRAAR